MSQGEQTAAHLHTCKLYDLISRFLKDAHTVFDEYKFTSSFKGSEAAERLGANRAVINSGMVEVQILEKKNPLLSF